MNIRRKRYLKAEESLSEYRRIARRRIITAAIFTILAVILAYHLSILSVRSDPSKYTSGVNIPKAIIIDGIGLTKPNLSFLRVVYETLSQAGFDVEIYIGRQVTMKLLDNMKGYKLIVLRVHSAVDAVYGDLYLFSAEAYNPEQYIYEQLYGEYREAYTFDMSEGPYFAIRADLLGDYDGLKDTVIILMGCNGTSSDNSIRRFFDRGVKAIIAWDGYVSLEYTDKVTSTLLRLVYTEKLSYSEAVQKIMNDMGPDPIWRSKLVYLTNPEI